MSLFKLSNVCRETWFFIHFLGYTRKETQLHNFFVLLSKKFVCPKCRGHITTFIMNNKVPSTFEESISFHNFVSKRIGKKNFDDIPYLVDLYKNKKIFERVTLTGFIYIYMLTYVFDKELNKILYNDIFIPFKIISFKQTENLQEIFNEVCDKNNIDKNIFKKENYNKILKEVYTKDYIAFK